MKIEISNKQTALITGTSLVIMTVISGFTMGLVFKSIFTVDADQFRIEIQKINSLFYWGIIGFIIILFLDMVVSIGLYQYYKTKNKKLASIMGGLRFLYVIIFAIAILKLVAASFLLSDIETNYRQIFNLVNAFQAIWHFGLIIFGFHLITLAPLVFKKQTILFGLSVLLFIAGIGYMLSNISDLLVPDYEQYRSNVEAIFILPMILGELGLAIWLLLKRRRETKTQFVSESC